MSLLVDHSTPISITLSLLFSPQHEAHWKKKKTSMFWADTVLNVDTRLFKTTKVLSLTTPSVFLENPMHETTMALTLWQEVVANYKPPIQIDRLQSTTSEQCCSVYWCVYLIADTQGSLTSPHAEQRNHKLKAMSNKNIVWQNNMAYHAPNHIRLVRGLGALRLLADSQGVQHPRKRTLHTAQDTEGKQTLVLILRLHSTCTEVNQVYHTTTKQYNK